MNPPRWNRITLIGTGYTQALELALSEGREQAALWSGFRRPANKIRSASSQV